MASLLRYLLLLGELCLVLGVDSGNTKDKCKHGAVNGSVTFLVSSSSPPVSILWTKGQNKVVNWDKGHKIKPYGSFVGRIDLNTTSGDLTIFNLSKSDAGEYIYDDIKLKFCLEVYDPLPPPKIEQRSSKVFECLIPDSYQEQSIPVTFSWNCPSPVCENCSTSIINFGKTDSLPPEITCTIDNGISSNNATFLLTPELETRIRWFIIGSIMLACIAVIIYLSIHFEVIRKICNRIKGKDPETVMSRVEYTSVEPQDTPVSAEPQDAPVSAETQDAPVSAETQDAPVSAEPQDAPVSAETQNAPVSAETQDAPVSAEPQDTPASAETQDAPVSAQTQDTPASAETQDTPVP